ncbi:MAG TPA: HEAT repeat domain-containing protein [Bryobacteraceae bacterium]|nr:HEAT repeat domain-containing protein [Bryobacteraceae bacterium]HPU71908.1 HEAT repeat domain-containing protein [Bryobacteraceae bacterium]
MSASAGQNSFRERLKANLDRFEDDPSTARNGLRLLLNENPEEFCAAAAPFLIEGKETAAGQFLLELLAGKSLLPLCNPLLLSLEEEIVIARAVLEKDPLLDVKLARRISALVANPTRGQTEVAIAQRILDILAAITDGARILPILIQVLRDPDGRLRSKAALLVGRTNKSAQWVEQILREPDARVRANSIEALWGVDTEAVRNVLRTATKDPNNRVLGNALLGLYRLGDMSIVSRVLSLAVNPAPLFRATAAWVMGESNDPRFLPILAQMVRETDARARHNVFRAIARIKAAVARYAESPPALVRICQVSDEPDGSRLVKVAIARADGGEIPGLRPTNVVLWDGKRIVADYSFRRTRAADWMALGIAMPAARTCPHPHGEVLEETVRGCLRAKRPLDRWAILRFGAPRDEDAPPLDTDVLPPCVLTPETAALAAALDNPENRYGYVQTVQSFLNTLAQSSGNRNLLLIEDRTAQSTLPEIPASRWTSLVADAEAASIAIHAVVLTDSGKPPGTLAEVCAQTGGTCMGANDLSGLSALFERIHLRLVNPYDLSYRPERPQSGVPIKLQVYSEHGCGEDSAQPQ